MTDGIEFIFVNDCTKDKSIEVLEAVLSEYPHRQEQVKIIHHEQNGGLVAARKTGLKYASGEYILHCDSDDWVDVRLCKEMYDKAAETDADMVYCNFCEDCNGQQTVFYEGEPCDPEAALSGKNSCCIWNKMFRTSIARSESVITPDHLVISEDVLRSIQTMALCQKRVRVDKVLYYYNIRPGSLAHTQWSPAIFRMRYEILTIFRSKKELKKYQLGLDFYCRSILVEAMMHRSIKNKDFYRIYSTIKTSILKDFRWSFMKKLAFLVMYITYWMVPKSETVDLTEMLDYKTV
jgi:glycosyltransferase involved in cell wall biosynthesis